MPVDIHAVYDPTGATTLLKLANIPGGDGATVPGIPINPDSGKAKLFMYGAQVLAAKYIAELQLLSLDMIDAQNGENLNIGGSSLLLHHAKWTNLPFYSAARNISVLQVAAGLEAGFTIDYYDDQSVEPNVMGSHFPDFNHKTVGSLLISMLAPGSNSTPNTLWNSYPVTQAATGSWLTAIANGKYAILGASVSNIANVGLLKFSHANFGMYQPGFPVVNRYDVALSQPVNPMDELMRENDYQFVKFSEMLKKPCCPVFNVNGNSTGLNVWYYSQVAEKPLISLNLAKIG